MAGVVSDINTYFDADKPLSTTNFDPKGSDYNFRVRGASSANNNIDTITAPSRGDGHILILEGADNTATVTLRDDQAGTNLVLGGNARVLGDGDVIVLRYSQGYWRELVFKPREGFGGGIQAVTTTVDASAGGVAQTTTIAVVPAGALLLNVHARVATVFNGDTTTTLEVGVSGNADAYIDTADFDVTSATAQQSMIDGAGGTNDVETIEYSATARTIIATWTNDDNASTGSVVVTVLYMIPN